MSESKMRNKKHVAGYYLKSQKPQKVLFYMPFSVGRMYWPAAVWIFSFMIFTGGCALIKETAKGVGGISTQALENGRKDAITKEYDCSYENALKQVEEKLARMGAYVYCRNAGKKMIAIYISEIDTTPVGIFFTEIGASRTRIEISSPSTYGKEFVSQSIFSALDNALNPQKGAAGVK